MEDPRGSKIIRDPSLTHLPPQSLEAEDALLCAIILENTFFTDICGILTPTDFYRTAHQKIFKAMADLYSINEPVDLVTLVTHLRALNQIEEIGGAAFLANLIDNVPAAHHPVSYANIIKEKSNLRKLIQHSNAVIHRCFECETEGVTAIIDFAQAGSLQIGQGLKSDRAHPIGEVIESTISDIEDASTNKKLMSGISTGFYKLDEMTSGLQNTDLIVIAARPSAGKTSLALNIARNAAVDSNIPTAIFSMEMSKEQLGMRLICADSRVNSTKVRTGRLNRDEWVKITDAAGMISCSPLFIDDDSGLRPSDICRRARKLKKEQNIGLIFIDYLQMMKNDRDNPGRRDLEIRDAVMSLKDLAKELEIPVVLLSQLNRKLEDRSDKRPQLADLRDGGAIEEAADVVAFIYRDEVYNKDENNPNRGRAEIDFAKQRNGPTGMKMLTWVGAYGRFENMAIDYGAIP